MTLESQVVSLELAKRLKELGIQKIESLYCFVLESDGTWTLTTQDDRERRSFYIRDEWCSAFTVAELGEMLPWIEIKRKRYIPITYQFVGKEGFKCDLIEERMKEILRAEVASTEADARAKMLIYLLENKLITL